METVLVHVPVRHVAGESRALLLGARAQRLPVATRVGQLGLEGGRLSGTIALRQLLPLLLQALQGGMAVINLGTDHLEYSRKSYRTLKIKVYFQ